MLKLEHEWLSIAELVDKLLGIIEILTEWDEVVICGTQYTSFIDMGS